MNIATVSISDLILDPNNARKHDAKNLESITESLRQFGQRKPIVVWRNTVVAGNGTLVAAKNLGWLEIQIARIPDAWDEIKVKAYAIADNRTSELATWDQEVLDSQLLEIEESGFDVKLLAFDLKSVPLPENLLDDVEPRLDQRDAITCPNCACEFRKTASGFEIV